MADQKDKKVVKVKRPTAKKRDLQSQKREIRNRAFKSAIRKKIRSLKEAVEKKEEALQDKLNEVYSLLDRGVKRGIYKKNAAGRSKSRLATQVLKTTAKAS
jgi:small subunit ribosomal protein S20